MSRTDQLDAYCADKQPIRLGASHNFRFKCKAMDTVDAQGKVNINPEIDPKLIDLSGALIAFGGESTCLPDYEEDLNKIVTRGQLWGRKSLNYLKGARSKCHLNSSLAWQANQDKIFIATGYALSKDGTWHQHSWCVQVKDNGPCIIETTEARELYFGFVLTLDESIEFVDMNTDEGCDLQSNTLTLWQSRFPELYQKPVKASSKRPFV